jgi:hypothetical protein
VVDELAAELPHRVPQDFSEVGLEASIEEHDQRFDACSGWRITIAAIRATEV